MNWTIEIVHEYNIDFTCESCNKEYSASGSLNYEETDSDIEENIEEYIPYRWTYDEENGLHCHECSERFKRTGMYMTIKKQSEILKKLWERASKPEETTDE